MDKLYWFDKLAFNNDKIDNQHKEIYKLINEMIETEKLSPRTEKFAEILSKLTDYGLYHFKAEEALMQSSAYPNFNEHFEEHQDYLYQVAMFNANFKDDDYTEPAEVLAYVRNWWSKHIQKKDMKFSAYLKGLKHNNINNL